MRLKPLRPMAFSSKPNVVFSKTIYMMIATPIAIMNPTFTDENGNNRSIPALGKYALIGAIDWLRVKSNTVLTTKKFTKYMPM